MGDSTASRIWAFRVEDIPPGMTYQGLKECFHKDDQSAIQVKSLVPAVDFGLGGGLTATISFKSKAISVQKPRLLDKHLIIDDKFFGFTPLFYPEGPIVADVIAITGLAGHAFASWAQTNGDMWLRDYLPKDVKNVRILTYGYNSQLQGNEARSSLLSHSKNFIHRLGEMRKVTESEERPIIFVGHSLGCLIIKNALIEINGFTSNMPHLPVPAIIFFGSPNRGLETLELESFVKGAPSQDLVEELRPESSTLEGLNDKFRHVAGGISILSCFELLGTPTAIKMSDGRWKREGPAKLMVPRYSALLDLPGEVRLACQANHTQIAKLERGENGYYWAIRSAVLKVAGSPTSSLGVGSDNDNLDNSQHSPQKKIGGTSLHRDNYTTGTSRICRPSPDRIPKKAVNVTMRTQRDIPSRGGFLSPDLKPPEQLRSNVNLSVEGEVASALARDTQKSGDAPSDPDTAASTTLRTTPETKPIHLSQSIYEQDSNGKNSLASNLPSQQQLCQAVRIGDIRCATALVNNGCSPHTSNEEAAELANDPFLLAATYREEKILELFLKFHARPLKHTLETNHTALHLLGLPFEGEQKSVTRSLVTLLLRCGIPIEVRNIYDQTPLMLGVRRGESGLVSYLLDSGADVMAIHYLSGRTPLHWASYYDRPQIADNLISKGASLEVRTKSGFTPLLEAASRGNLGTLRSLLDHGANLQARTNDGVTALGFAVWYNHPAVLTLLSAKGSTRYSLDRQGLTPLMRGSQRGHTEVLRALLDLGIDLETRDHNGLTALHHAARAGHLSAVNYLASRGACLDVKDREGHTPLIISIRDSHSQVLECLLLRGADFKASDSQGWTPLHHAAHKGFFDAVESLVSRGAPLEARTSNIKHTFATPLHVSTYRKDNPGWCTNLLLKAGADMEALDVHGWTALKLAARHGAVSALKELIASGASVEAGEKSERKQRALHKAKFYGEWQIVEVLLRNGADPFASDLNHNIPSQLRWFEGTDNEAAPSKDHKDRCVRLLKDAEVVERRNRNRKENDRRALEEAKEQQEKLKRCSKEALKGEEEISERIPEVHRDRKLKPTNIAKNIDKQRGEWTRSRSRRRNS